MIPFDFQLRTRIVFGPGTIDSLGSLARELGSTRALVVTDPGLEDVGHAQRGVESLNREHITTLVFDGVCENPTTSEVETGAEVAADFAPDLLIGLGGGSSMDCAKGINFLHTNGGHMRDYWGVGKATRPMLPMIAVPTTAGTGSETQSFALISDAETLVKMACGDRKAACRVALLDPVLTLTQPARVTALTGIDALAHSIETYVTKPRNSISLAFSREAWRLLAGNFERVVDQPDDLEARGGMLLGACLAGLAIENSMLGATHALANPLTANYGVAHGQAIAFMLPHVIRYNGQQVDRWYQDLLTALNGAVLPKLTASGAEGVAQLVERLMRQAGLATRLHECQVSRGQLPKMAAEAASQWTGSFNPRPATADDYLNLYQQAF